MKKRISLQIAIIFSLAMISMGIWQLEIINRFGWAGLAWLNKGHFSIYLITIFVILAYLLPFSSRMKDSRWHLLYPGMVLFLISIIGFHLGKTLLFIAFSRFSLVPLPILLAAIILLWGLTAYFFHVVTKRWIAPVKKSHFFLVIISIIGTIPLSLITVKFYNGPSSDQYTSFVDAVKTGLPYFWIVINLGITGLYTNQFLIADEPASPVLTREDILDDQAF